MLTNVQSVSSLNDPMLLDGLAKVDLSEMRRVVVDGYAYLACGDCLFDLGSSAQEWSAAEWAVRMAELTDVVTSQRTKE